MIYNGSKMLIVLIAYRSLVRYYLLSAPATVTQRHSNHYIL